MPQDVANSMYMYGQYGQQYGQQQAPQQGAAGTSSVPAGNTQTSQPAAFPYPYMMPQAPYPVGYMPATYMPANYAAYGQQQFYGQQGYGGRRYNNYDQNAGPGGYDMYANQNYN